MAAFGDIDSSITLAASQGVRRNSGNTAFEAVTLTIDGLLPSQGGNSGKFLTTNGSVASWATISTGITIGNAVTGGGANRVLYEDGSQNLAANSNFIFDSTGLAVGRTSASAKLHAQAGTGVVAGILDGSQGADGTAVLQVRRADLTGQQIEFFPNFPAGTSTWGIRGGVSDNSPNGIFTEVSNQVLSYGINVPQIGTRYTTQSGGIFRLDTRAGENRFIVFGYPIGSSTPHERIAVSLENGNTALCIQGGDCIIGGVSGSASARLHVIATTEQQRTGYDASNYESTTISSTGVVTRNAVGSGAKFVFSDAVEVPDDAYDSGWNGDVSVPTKNALYDHFSNMGWAKNNQALGSPTTGDDNTQGYDAGSIWLDLSGGKAYACFDASTGAADWQLLN